MTLTLLFDLDDTLLDNDIDRFLPVYLQKLANHLVDYVEADRLVGNLLAATQVMLNNNAAGMTLERAFDQAFYPRIGYTKAALRGILEQFYDEIFPGLESITARRPDAVRVVNSARENGHTVVIATNPLFPIKAILHRLRWAGLDPDRETFDLVTGYERFHFAKPKPAFFTEILAQLGWPDQPAVVIGDSLEFDLQPASRLGLPVFWINEQPAGLPEGSHPLSASGSLAEVPAWLEQVDAASLDQDFLAPPALLAVLQSTPAAFDTLAIDLPLRQWQNRPQPGDWSLTEITCHLRDVDREVNIPRIQTVIAGGNPFLPGIDTDTWAVKRDYFNENGPAALREWIDVRSTLVELLSGLPPVDWQRPARHAIFGPTNLLELVSFISTHDRSHVQEGFSVAHVQAL